MLLINIPPNTSGALMDNPHSLRNWIRLRKEYKKPIDDVEFERGVELAEWYKETYDPHGWTASELNAHNYQNWWSDNGAGCISAPLYQSV